MPDNTSLWPPVIAATAVIVAAIGGAAWTHLGSAKRAVAEAHRLHKVQVYTEFADIVVDMFSGVKALDLEGRSEEEKARKQAELTESVVPRLFEFSKKLLLWGSPEVIRAYERFRSIGQSIDKATPESSAAVLLAVDDVFRAMRRDLDLKNEGLDRGTLLKLFLTDPQVLDRRRAD